MQVQKLTIKRSFLCSFHSYRFLNLYHNNNAILEGVKYIYFPVTIMKISTANAVFSLV